MKDEPQEIYLDNNATTRPIPEVVDAVLGILTTGYGNPSSAHQRGSYARRTLEMARAQVASLVGASEDQVFFTSGGTESNNLALNRVSEKEARHLVTTETEHSSVLKKARFFEQRGVKVTYMPVDCTGRVNVRTLKNALKESVDLVSVHWINNETGTEQPVWELGEVCRERGVAFHIDAAQAAGKLEINFNDMPVDMLTFSGHKIHGPQGVGALCVKQSDRVFPVLFGGDQERFIRPGTENLPGVAGFGVAAEIREKDLLEIKSRIKALRDRFEERLIDVFPGLCINGDKENRVCNTSNILFSGVDGMALMAQLDREGVICSQTSACNSRSPEPSHVLLAMGLSQEEAFSSVRFSFSVLNTLEETEIVADKVTRSYRKLLEFEGREVF